MTYTLKFDKQTSSLTRSSNFPNAAWEWAVRYTWDLQVGSTCDVTCLVFTTAVGMPTSKMTASKRWHPRVTISSHKEGTSVPAKISVYTDNLLMAPHHRSVYQLDIESITIHHRRKELSECPHLTSWNTLGVLSHRSLRRMLHRPSQTERPSRHIPDSITGSFCGHSWRESRSLRTSRSWWISESWRGPRSRRAHAAAICLGSTDLFIPTKHLAYLAQFWYNSQHLSRKNRCFQGFWGKKLRVVHP